MSDQYQFTQDWFSWVPDVWAQLLPMLPARKSFLEIGSYEGRSALWMAENMLEDGGEIVAVDTWEGGEEHKAAGLLMHEVEARFDSNIAAFHASVGVCPDDPEQFIRHIWKVKQPATLFLASQLVDMDPGKGWQFDFIYIDGSHLAKDVLTDACMSWPLLKKGGLLVFDDYLWGNPRDALHRPKVAVDAFTTIFGEELQVAHAGYQFVVQKGK